MPSVSDAEDSSDFVLVIHAGAGSILKQHMTREKEDLVRAGLEETLEAGREVLLTGGTAVDAVTAAVKVTEISKRWTGKITKKLR